MDAKWNELNQKANKLYALQQRIYDEKIDSETSMSINRGLFEVVQIFTQIHQLQKQTDKRLECYAMAALKCSSATLKVAEEEGYKSADTVKTAYQYALIAFRANNTLPPVVYQFFTTSISSNNMESAIKAAKRFEVVAELDPLCRLTLLTYLPGMIKLNEPAVQNPEFEKVLLTIDETLKDKYVLSCFPLVLYCWNIKKDPISTYKWLEVLSEKRPEEKNSIDKELNEIRIQACLSSEINKPKEAVDVCRNLLTFNNLTNEDKQKIEKWNHEALAKMQE